MSAAVSIYIYDHTPSGQSRLYKHIKSLDAYTVQYHMLCFKTYRGTMYYYYCCTLWTGFYPPDLCLSTCKEFIVRSISYVVFQNIVITTVLFF